MTEETDKALRAAYFDWLYRLNFPVRDPDSPMSFVYLCANMHSVRFRALVPNDVNRASEGEALRDEYINTLRDVDIFQLNALYSMGDASIFEMLIGLSRRADFIVEIGPPFWLMTFIENLGLRRYDDEAYVQTDSSRIKKILHIFNERKYRPDGHGGIFPLQRADRDQRKIEIWAQMSAYMTENELY